MHKMWRFHRSVALDGFEADGSGHWGYIRPGADVVTYDGSMSRFGFESLVCFPSGGWWSALFLIGAPVDLHVDIATPASVVDGIVTTIDLDLDVVVRAGKTELLDVDEFEQHRVVHGYPDSHVRAAEHAALFVPTLIAAGAFPFDGSHTARMSRMRALATE
jgi:protein associated with RNAse G/E